MLQINTAVLASLFCLTITAVYLIAWIFKDKYDLRYYLKAYLLYFVPFVVLGIVLKLGIMLILGIYLFGAVILIFRNQHYFDK